ncbi:MAG: hypothetical protein AB3N16_01980 [Flavobacteriaceae bacterium]
MRLYKYILALAIFSLSCEKDNIGPLLDGDTNIIFFNNALIYVEPENDIFDESTTTVSVGEQETEHVVIEVGAVLTAAKSAQISLGGTATQGVDYTIIGDLSLDFPAGSSVKTIAIALIDNENFDDDHTITLSLPKGLGYSENNRRELTVNIINNELSSGTVVSAITNSSDDVEEGINGNSPGAMDVGSTDLEFGETEGSTRGVEHIGLRFNGISIPNGAKIRSARIQFTVDEDVDEPADVVMTIAAEAVDDAVTYDASDFNLTNRTLTTASVDWNIPVWATVGEAGPAQKTVDIKSVIQEIIDRPGWGYDNSINIIFSPTTETLANPRESGRVAESFDGDPDKAPVLTIDWEL